MGYFKKFFNPYPIEPLSEVAIEFDPLDIDKLKIEHERREQRKLHVRAMMERNHKLGKIKDRRRKSLRPGFVYFKLNPTTRLIKIGFTSDLKTRSQELNRKEGTKLETLGIITAGFRYEARLHRMFARYRWAGEWFEPSDLILKYISVFTEQPKPYQVARTDKA
jgi:hypothetical protein